MTVQSSHNLLSFLISFNSKKWKRRRSKRGRVFRLRSRKSLLLALDWRMVCDGASVCSIFRRIRCVCSLILRCLQYLYLLMVSLKVVFLRENKASSALFQQSHFSEAELKRDSSHQDLGGGVAKDEEELPDNAIVELPICENF